MKTLILISLLLAGEAQAVDSSFWLNVRGLVLKCAVRPYTIDFRGTRQYKPLRSICPELRRTPTGATFMLGGHYYTALLKNSAHSDGGDLNDLDVLEFNRVQAKRSAVPAFGDPLLALAGGGADFREERTR